MCVPCRRCRTYNRPIGSGPTLGKARGSTLRNLLTATFGGSRIPARRFCRYTTSKSVDSQEPVTFGVVAGPGTCLRGSENTETSGDGRGNPGIRCGWLSDCPDGA